MKKTVFICVILLAAGAVILSGCSRITDRDVSGGIPFEELSEEESSRYLEDFDVREPKAQLVHKGLTGIKVAVNIPFNAVIEGIALDDNDIMTIDLHIDEELERQDIFTVVGSSVRKVIQLGSKYRKYFENDDVIFSVDGRPVEHTLDYFTALLMGQDFMDTDFTVDACSLALYPMSDEYRMTYIFSFADTENMNRTGNETITGAIAVDGENGDILEYRIFSRNRFPGTYRFASDLQAKGWKDDTTIVALDDQEYYLVGFEGNMEPLETSGAQDIIDAYSQETSQSSRYIFTQKCDKNDQGFIYTISAELTRLSDNRKVSVPVPQNTYIAYHEWGSRGNNLYFTTEPAELIYGNTWSYYTIWRYDTINGILKELGKLPSREFYLSPDESRLSFNGPDGDLYIMNIDKLIKENDIMK